MPKYLAPTLGVFLHKIAIDYVRHGYYRYYQVRVNENKADQVERIDRKILNSYKVTYHYTTRSLRKKRGEANIAYVRFGLNIILLATDGELPEEVAKNAEQFLDIRQTPIRYSGYTILVRRILRKGGIEDFTPVLRMSLRRQKAIRKQLLSISLHNRQKIVCYFQRISPFMYPGILNQKWKLLKTVNKKRKAGGLKPISWIEAKKWRYTKGYEPTTPLPFPHHFQMMHMCAENPLERI